MKPTLEALSDEILVGIFSFLSARDLCRCSKVCSSWCRLANDFHLWKNLFIKTFNRFVSDPSFYNNVTPSQWKELYILKSNWFSGHCHVQQLKKESPVHSDSVLTKVTCLKISKCGENILSSVNQGSKIVNIWSLEDKRGLHVVRCEGVVSSLDFGCLRSRNLLAIGLSCNKFCLWDFKLARYRLHQTNLNERSLEDFPILQNISPPFNLSDSTVVRVNLVDDKLATVTQDCIIKVWQLNFRPDGSVSCQPLHTLSTNKPRCSVLDIQLKHETVNGYWSVSISHAAEVLENWNLIGFQSLKFQGINLVNFESPVITPAIHYTGFNTDIDYHLEDKQEYKRQQQESMSSRTFISCLSISPCTKLVTSGQNDNTISLWDTSTKTRRHTLFGHTGSVTCTDVDRHKVVSGSNDRTVKVWSLESGDCQLTLPEDHSSGVSCVTFNDQWVVSGDNSGEIKVWDFAVNSLSVLQSQDSTELK
ncbi:F-box/WD repeat-containing protein 11-like [Actinia tenebrosa]|uniref:F-box/WD repeat-containing protein 11-like n=1 Tax=Actinia tenebrosa TaxID=6105 RepID=A0A6P8HHM6_ACTTE|nr:F-box/WD repeat-containing protein 11-like [Actinia tenebrosa]